MRPHILVIDDSKAVRRIASAALAPFDCDVAEATNGFTGLFAMERVLPDLLLLDVAMPTMDGLEMLTLLKGHELLKKVRVIMLTSSTDHQVLPRIVALGVDAQLRKPFTPETLVETVRSVIPLRPASTKPDPTP